MLEETNVLWISGGRQKSSNAQSDKAALITTRGSSASYGRRMEIERRAKCCI